MQHTTHSLDSMNDEAQNIQYQLDELNADIGALDRTIFLLREQQHRKRAEAALARHSLERNREEFEIANTLPARAEHPAELAALRALFGTRKFKSDDRKTLLSADMLAWLKDNATKVEVRLWLPEDVPALEVKPVVCLYAKNPHTLMRFEQQFADEIKQRWG